ncbi:hypothetical protein BS78_K179100 [Paspalum vaginatum]|uniref:F-box domain-containing protein n=1 Tax=Paspalum vaginatum TaxID=158149 RepID=A0A9W7XDL8_9POAL|nr:hypothetical protein BS78_K179100 [Paspalum vaginatum]
MAQDITSTKKKSKRATSLPDEIINEILLLLPARSILRFYAVYRLWAAHLSSPAFKVAYAAKGEARQMSNIIIFAASPGHHSTTVYSCSNNQGADAEPLFTMDHLRTDSLYLSSKSSRGLLLFSNTRTTSGGDYWVCNPSTGECRALPQQRHLDLISSSVGLVLDDQTKEFKVVYLFLKTMIRFGCDVYMLGVDSADLWWRPRTAGDDILRFSAADENFDFIGASSNDMDMGEDDDIWLEEHMPVLHFHMAELQGSLCMVHDLHQRRGHGVSSSIHVWVLRDRNNGGCEWSMDYRFTVTPLLARDVHSPRFITILGVISGSSNREEKRLLFATSQHKVYAYSPNSGGVKMVFSTQEVGIGSQEAGAGLWLGTYEDSLMRIGGECRREKEVSLAVRETWCTLIERESFVATHMSMKRPTTSILMITNGRARRAFFAFAQLESWLDQAASSPFGVGGTLADAKIICSKPCHGLNLISTSSDGAIQCLGIRGRSRFCPLHSSRPPAAGRHAFSIGRNIGFGFDHSTGEHVAVEIGRHLCGTLACMVKASESDAWISVGTHPVPVTDMPAAHTQATASIRQAIIVVAFDISTWVFSVLECEKPLLNNNHRHYMLLAELNEKLSLVVADRDAEEMEIWTMHERRARINARRALGYYNTKTGAIGIVYSLQHLQFLLEFWVGRCRSCKYPEHAFGDSESGTPRPIIQKCQNVGCVGDREIYSTCCKRVICRMCIRWCPEHFYQRHHIPLDNIYQQRHGLPMEHPSVPDPDYCCYSYSTIDNDAI